MNVDVTPETATRLAMAYGTTLGRGDQVVASRDAHPGVADDQARDDRRPGRDRRVGRGPARGDQRGRPLRGQEHRRAGWLPRADLRPRPGAHPDHVLRAATASSPPTRRARTIEKYFNRQEVRRALLNQLGDLSFPPRVNEAYVYELRVAPRRRADPRGAVPDRARLRVLGRRDGDADPAARAAGRVVLDALLHGPRRAGDPGRGPARVHDPDRAAGGGDGRRPRGRPRPRRRSGSC